MDHFKTHPFPTVVQGFDNLLTEKQIDVMKKDIVKSSKGKKNWQSNSKIHENKKYKPLVDKILKISKIVFDDYKYVYEKFEITDMWSNIIKPNEAHKAHTHPNNLLSGVYYVDSDNINIHFIDPRTQALVIAPKVENYIVENSQTWFFPSITNRIILFPSWLEHYVPQNNTNKDRISISFNVMLRGLVGSSNEYKSARF